MDLVDDQIKEALEDLSTYRDISTFESAAAREHATEEILPIIEQVSQLVRALDHAGGLPTGVDPRRVRNQLNSLRNAVRGLAQKPDDQSFYQALPEATGNINTHLRNLLNELRDGLAVAVTLGAPLGYEDLQARVASLDEKLETREAELDERVDQTLEKIRAEASGVLARARESAGHVALSEAQGEFSRLRDGYLRKSIGWGIATILGIGLYALLLWYFIQNTPDPTGHLGDSIYPASIRIVALGAGGAVLAVLIRLFRANLHLFEHSSHRISLINSMPVFYESVAEGDRKFVLGLMVSRIAEFGEAGSLAGKPGDENPRSGVSPVEELFRLRE